MSKCRICECSELDGCNGAVACTWAQPDLCSTCADFLEVMAAYMIIAGPLERQTLACKVAAVERCLEEISKANEVEPEEESLIVITGS